METLKDRQNRVLKLRSDLAKEELELRGALQRANETRNDAFARALTISMVDCLAPEHTPRKGCNDTAQNPDGCTRCILLDAMEYKSLAGIYSLEFEVIRFTDDFEFPLTAASVKEAMQIMGLDPATFTVGV